jgi:hypothetical protein
MDGELDAAPNESRFVRVDLRKRIHYGGVLLDRLK